MNVTELRHTALFQSLDTREFEQVSMSMNISEKEFEKGEIILHAGSAASSMCLVLEGSVRLESGGAFGERSVLQTLGEGEFFAESCAILKREKLTADVCAAEECRVLFIGIGTLMGNSNLNTAQIKLLKNLLRMSVADNMLLSYRSFDTSHKTARGRITSYLSRIALQKGKKSFEIPLDRKQMADYLNLDRTALSKELGRMKREGLIDFRKNRFVILK